MSKRSQISLDAFFTIQTSKKHHSNNETPEAAIWTETDQSTEESDQPCSSTDSTDALTEISRDPAKGNQQEAFRNLSLNLGPYQPKQLDFPKRNNRKFRPDWYNEYEWLEYSPSTDSAYCFFCRTFPSGQAKSRSDQAFVSVGFNNWKKSMEKFRDHQNSFSHKEACAKVVNFKSSQVTGSVVCKVDKQYEMIASENRNYLKCILDTLLYCARQGIGLRGHREDEDSQNRGNFLELLKLRSNDNEIIRRYYIEKEKTFTYISPEYQNLFLKYMADSVLRNIAADIKSAGIFSLIVDETQDLGRHEQVAIVIRYVDDGLQPHESFVGFHRTEKCDAESLVNLIKSKLHLLGLKIEDLRAQCYDGAAAMRGSYSGVQSRLRSENARAIYVHCYAHILNLCVIDLTKQVSYVRNTFGILNSLHNFIAASSKRNSVFERIVEQSCISQKRNEPKTLKSLSDTRWSCRAEALRSVVGNITEIISTLSEIEETDPKSGPEANGLLNSIETFEFIFCVKFLKEVLTHVNILSKFLQSPNLNYSVVTEMVHGTINVLINLRSEIHFEKLWDECEELSEKMKLKPPQLPRKRKIPQKLGGGEQQQELTSAKDYYRVNIYYRVLDIVSNEMENKFQENDLAILGALSDVLSNEKPNDKSYDLIVKMYGIDMESLKAEVKIFSKMFSSSGCINSFKNRLNYIKNNDVKNGFENLYLLYKIFIAIPTNTATCERSFSCLRRLKTYLRISTGQERLSNLALLYIEREREINKDLIINEFDADSKIRGRRIALN